MSSDGKNEKSLTTLRQEFENVFKVLEQEHVQKVIADVREKRLSQAEGELSLQAALKQTGRPSPIINASVPDWCFDFIIVHYRVGEGWDWGRC